METEEIFGQCEPLGEPVLVDLDGKRFYSSIVVHNMMVKIGDCARVVLESDDQTENFAFCQVLAIYDDPDPEVGVMVEARWLLTPEEVNDELGKKNKS